MGGQDQPLANIGPVERRKRFFSGVIELAIGLAAALVTFSGGSRWWLVLVFALFWLGALGVLQARAHT